MTPRKICIQRKTEMPFDPGRIILVSYPFTDQTGAKLRPALVISGAKFNAGEDFVAVPLSSRVEEPSTFGFVISDTDNYFADTGLRRASTVKWSKPMTISRRVVQRQLGIIPDDVLKQIRQRLCSMFS